MSGRMLGFLISGCGRRALGGCGFGVGFGRGWFFFSFPFLIFDY